MRKFSGLILLGASALAISAATTGATGATGSKDPSEIARGGGGRGGDFRGGGGDFRGGDFNRDNFNRDNFNRNDLNRDANQYQRAWDENHNNYGDSQIYAVPVPTYDNGDAVDSSYYDDSNQIYNENNNNQY